MSTNTSGNEPKEDVFVVICQPYGCYDEIFRMPPDTHITRAGCGHLIWITPPGEIFLLNHPEALTTCFACQPEADENYLVPGARDAAVLAFGHSKDVARFDRYIKRNNITEWPG
jgi:hypothetical protein